MKQLFVSLLTVAIFAFGAFAWAADRRQNRPNDHYGDSIYRYKGSSGAEYQYDLSRPGDKFRYEIDLKAQMRDQLSVDPKREIDRGLGQQGGGSIGEPIKDHVDDRRCIFIRQIFLGA
jgi:hypothetical protein